jgi:FAD/FMN-containing dehydrogenase
MLPDSMLVRVYFNGNDHQRQLDKLDMMTSKAIKLGGVVNSNRRESLEKINPFIVERMLGAQGLELQRSLKHSFDPNNVLSPDFCIPTTEALKIARNPFLWLKWRNKHMYYFLTL